MALHEVSFYWSAGEPSDTDEANLVFLAMHPRRLRMEDASRVNSQEDGLEAPVAAAAAAEAAAVAPCLSEWLLLTPLLTPEVECLEALLMVEKALWHDCKLVMDPCSPES